MLLLTDFSFGNLFDDYVLTLTLSPFMLSGSTSVVESLYPNSVFIVVTEMCSVFNFPTHPAPCF